MAGLIASALIVAVCGGVIHSIVDLRRAQARAAGVRYMDPARKAALVLAGTIAGAYAIFLIAALAGS